MLKEEVNVVWRRDSPMVGKKMHFMFSSNGRDSATMGFSPNSMTVVEVTLVKLWQPVGATGSTIDPTPQPPLGSVLEHKPIIFLEFSFSLALMDFFGDSLVSSGLKFLLFRSSFQIPQELAGASNKSTLRQGQISEEHAAERERGNLGKYFADPLIGR
jgi:hypothetical protein